MSNLIDIEFKYTAEPCDDESKKNNSYYCVVHIRPDYVNMRCPVYCMPDIRILEIVADHHYDRFIETCRKCAPKSYKDKIVVKIERYWGQEITFPGDVSVDFITHIKNVRAKKLILDCD